MKILVIGGGGREHALIWKLSQSKDVNAMYCIPGNGGISDMAECVAMDVNKTGEPVSYTHLRAHETDSYLVCRLLLAKKKL
jgi:phosphoribosylamine-glycine ligase